MSGPRYIRAGSDYFCARTLRQVASIYTDSDGTGALVWEEGQEKGFRIEEWASTPEAAEAAVREFVRGLDALSAPPREGPMPWEGESDA